MIFVNKFCFMDKVVSRICPLDLMMKYVQFQVKKRLSHEVPKVTVELSSAVGLSAHPSLSAASACLAR